MNLHADDAVLLRQMAADVADLAGKVSALAAGVAVGADAAFVHAVHDAFGEREFSASELLQRGRWRDAPGRLLAALTQQMTTRSAGIRLGQLRGLPTATGLVVVQTSTNRDGAVWRVWAFQDSQQGPQPVAPAGTGAPD